MEKEKQPASSWRKKFLYEPEHICDAAPPGAAGSNGLFVRDYKSFLNAAKTEREAVSEIVRRVRRPQDTFPSKWEKRILPVIKSTLTIGRKLSFVQRLDRKAFREGYAPDDRSH